MRVDGRQPEELRPIRFERNFTRYSAGSVLVEFGETKVLCTASIEENVPSFLQHTGKGWVTAEYSMLPSATQNRRARDGRRGPVDGRTQEIQRLIGRSLRAAVDLGGFGERTIWVDCDVIQADGGTRTAAITGGFVALVDCFRYLQGQRTIKKSPLKANVGAISVGIVGGDPVTDLCYLEDSKADVDMNVVMNDRDEFIEIQGSSEGDTFGSTRLEAMLALAKKSLGEIFELQNRALEKV